MTGDGIEWDQRNSLLGPRLTQAVLNSSVPIDRLDDMVTRIGMYFATTD
jgi:beta-glucosidase